jgi:hypothetical protein
MDTEPVPIAYTALQRGTPVQTSDGREFGTVTAVLVDEPVDVFDGINVRDRGHQVRRRGPDRSDLHHACVHEPVLGSDSEHPTTDGEGSAQLGRA